MPRITGYKVTIKGWLTFDKTDLASQREAINAVYAAKDGDLSGLNLIGVSVETRQSSYDPDEGAQVKQTRNRGGK